MEAIILSHALDTNGQNARFVKAAKKYGRDKAVLNALAVGNDDPAGVVARYAIAAEKLGGLSIRSAHKASHYFEFPHDIIWNRSTELEIRELAQRADVIHLNNSFRAVQRFHLRKPTLLHHHGSLFRNNPPFMLNMARRSRWLQAVSTIDLQRPDPEVLHWLPSAYDIDAIAAFGKKHQREPDGRVRIVTCPTNRKLKHTELLIDVVGELRDEGLPIDLVVVGPVGPEDRQPDPPWVKVVLGGQTWETSLIEKAKADIVFDQLMFGYGCNSIEAWALGKPVIAGADPWTVNRMLDLWGTLPFYHAHAETLKADIRRLVEINDVRAAHAENGMHHVRKYHDEKPALERLAELYHMAIAEFNPPVRTAEEAVRFRSKRVQRMDGVVIAERGDNVVTDPLAIDYLRRIARTRPAYGVEEVTG